MSRFMLTLTILIAGGCASPREHPAEEGSAVTVVTVDSAPSVVDLNEIALGPGEIVRCRDMLKPGSNVIVTYCLTGEDWEQFERLEAVWAQEMLRSMRRGRFR